MKLKFSEQELIDILWAWAAISFAFAVRLGGGIATVGKDFPRFLILSGLTVGVAFLSHELSHKFLAQKYNCWAEFRKWNLGLFLAVFSSFIGFVFAAPGAVMISGSITKEQNGKISAAGPIMNIIIAGLIFILGVFLNALNIFIPLLQEIIGLGIMINLWLALFNMIPVPPLDGSKVISWSLPAWVILVGISLFGLIGLGFF